MMMKNWLMFGLVCSVCLMFMSAYCSQSIAVEKVQWYVLLPDGSQQVTIPPGAKFEHYPPQFILPDGYGWNRDTGQWWKLDDPVREVSQRQTIKIDIPATAEIQPAACSACSQDSQAVKHHPAVKALKGVRRIGAGATLRILRLKR